MNHRDDHPVGAPCWVDAMQPDPLAATRFYGELFGWTFDAPGPMPGGLPGEYRCARLGGRLVGGIGQAPPATPAVWSTYVRVDDVEQALARATDAGGTVVVGPLDAGRAGRMAVLTDTSGVAFAVWQPRERAGAERFDAPGTWAMSALHTPELDRARAFYGTLFGWTFETASNSPLALVRLPGHVGGEPGQPIPRDDAAVATEIPAGDPTPPHWAVNFRVDDADATTERARELGGTVLMPPTDTPGFRSAVILDPQQGVVAISAPAIMA